jgi:Xaa-Pro aminopeptidase
MALITSPASIAWLLNIRGSDVMCTPLTLSTATIDKHGKVQLFVNNDKLTKELRDYLGENVTFFDESSIENKLNLLSGYRVLVDPSSASSWFFDTLKDSQAVILKAQDPIALPRACKNVTEIKSTINAHKRDAVPLIRFLHWLDTKAQAGKETEISAAKQLEEFRHETGLLKDLSFESISGAGSNGAIVHYRVSEQTSKTLSQGSLYLIDSGAQYEDGTTDVTRTVPIGKPSDEMRHRFTLVLKGHIALASAYFPEGTTGSNLDALARMPLWQNGLDYDHGTGHGVGLYLGVHEGPQRISKAPNNVALEPGMILSNEPGYYKNGAYGIRIENLQYVTKPVSSINGERKMLSFETLTLAPIHKSLIDTTILNEQEKAYINEYHKTVYDKISPNLSGKTLLWLEKACKEL